MPEKRDEAEIRFEFIAFSDMVVDHRYQRDEMQVRRTAKQIENNFDEHMVGIFELAEWSGTLSVLDGQTRRIAMMRLGIEGTLCKVHYGMAPATQAIYFERFSMERTRITPDHQFKALVWAAQNGAKDNRAVRALRITEIAGKHGITVARRGGIRGPVALARIVDKYGETYLDQALDCVSVWNGEKDWLSVSLIEGLAIILHRYNLDPGEVKKKLQHVMPALIMGRFRGLAYTNSQVGRPREMARLLLDVYNDKRRSGRLDPEQLLRD